MNQQVQPTQGALAARPQQKVTTKVLNQLEKMRSQGRFLTPPNYSPEMALNSAWITLQETKDKTGRSVLTTCTEASIARALLNMVYKGLTPSKSQCYFVQCGNQLSLFVSYMGHIAMARRADPSIRDIVAHVVYDGELPEIDTRDGVDVLVSHKRNPFQKHKPEEAIGAYCNILYRDGSSRVTAMSIDEIHRCWKVGGAQAKVIGAAKESKAHRETPEEMMKRTVINRATKAIINTSDDACLFAQVDMELAEEARDETVKTRTNVVDVDFEPVPAPKPAPVTEPQPENSLPEPAPARMVDMATGEVVQDAPAEPAPAVVFDETAEFDYSDVPF